MGNIAYVSRRRGSEITTDQFLSTVKSINNEHFDGVFTIEMIFDDHGVQVSIDGEVWWQWWKESSRRWGGKYPSRRGKLGDWARTKFDTLIAIKLKCILSDEGVTGSWEPDPKYAGTFEQYMENAYSHMHTTTRDAFITFMTEEERARAPQSLVKFISIP